MKLFMVRHGQTTGNVAGLIYGQVDYPLTQKGRDQWKLLAWNYMSDIS